MSVVSVQIFYRSVCQFTVQLLSHPLLRYSCGCHSIECVTAVGDLMEVKSLLSSSSSSPLLSLSLPPPLSLLSSLLCPPPPHSHSLLDLLEPRFHVPMVPQMEMKVWPRMWRSSNKQERLLGLTFHSCKSHSSQTYSQTLQLSDAPTENHSSFFNTR